MPSVRTFVLSITIFGSAFIAVSNLAAQETVRFSDQFGGALDGWSLKGGDWSIQSGQLRGQFLAYCDNNRNWCPEGDLLLADEHQPRTVDWRMEVDFKFAGNSSPYGATNPQGAKAMFSLWSTYRIREVHSVGSNSGNAGPLTSAEVAVRAFGPWNAIAATSAPLNWDSSSFNKATIEKHGNVVSFYLNDQLVGTTSSTLPGSPKLGLHVAGSCLFDNFKLTEIGLPLAYSIGGTVRTSAGQPLSGVTVTAIPGGTTASTDATGKYTLPALDDRTTYTVKPAYSDALGSWTFSQPLYLKTVSGASMTGADFTALAPGTETETVRFTDDFSSTLSAWVSKGSSWWIENGHLKGEYSIICGNMLCYHTYLLLADQYLPRTADWRMEVDFAYVAHFWGNYYDANANFARWSSDTAAEMYYIGWEGLAWGGAPQSFARWMQQTYAPTWLVAHFTDSPTTTWSPQLWNRAKLEKRGDIFIFYLNDQVLGISTGSVLTGNPKLGFHIYGTTLLDNFKLTELGTEVAPGLTADLSLTQTPSAPTVVPGSPLTYTLSVSNAGPGTASNVQVSDTLPAGASAISASGVDWTCGVASNVVTCTLASLTDGGTSPITITITAPAGPSGTPLVNTATVASATEDPALANNTRTAVVELFSACSDFNGNSKSDVVWRNSATGEDALWLMNGVTLASALRLTTVDPNWTMAAMGDFTGNGQAGVIWLHNSTARVVIWLMNGTSISAATVVTTVNDVNWKIVGTGDVDGDGKSDVLWRNEATGDSVVWLMNGASIRSASHLAMVGDLNWSVAGVGDVNGDRMADVLWRHAVTGQNVVWLMNGASIGSALFTSSLADTNYRVIGVGDASGDRKADVLWWNQSTGDVRLWLMNGATVSSTAPVMTVSDLNWHAAGMGDFDGDSKADVIWRHVNSGDVGIWLMDGSTIKEGAFVDTVNDLNWSIVAPR